MPSWRSYSVAVSAARSCTLEGGRDRRTGGQIGDRRPGGEGKAGANSGRCHWVKQSIEQWTTAAGITKRPLLRPVSKSGKVGETALGDWSVWSVVESCAMEIGIKDFGLTTFAAPAQSSAANRAETSSRSSFCWGTRRFRRPSVILAPSRRSLSPSMIVGVCDEAARQPSSNGSHRR
jgi:hypothetical protein